MGDAQPKPVVSVLPDALGPHTMQLYAGLTTLARAGRLVLEYRSRVTPADRSFHRCSLWMSLEGANQAGPFHVCFDMFDGGLIATPDGLEKSQVYFKRSYDPAVVAGLPAEQARKVLPLGFFFASVGEDDRDIGRRLRIERSLRRQNGVPLRKSDTSYRRQVWVSSFSRPWWPGTLQRWLVPRTRDFEGNPNLRREPSILFQVRLWDPKVTSKDEHVPQMNERRADMVRALRRTFGKRFKGGVVPSEYSRRHFGDCLSNLPTDQATYLRMVKEARVGIVTEGVHRSIPRKCAEYLAGGTCMVSEPLAYEVPDPIRDGVDAMFFSTTEQCLAHCERLLTDEAYALGVQQAGHAYYQRFVRPEMLVARALGAAARRIAPDHSLSAALTG